MTEYTAARMIASEYNSGNLREWAAVLDAELNRAPRDLDKFTKHIAPRGIYGYQGSGRRNVATTRDPKVAQVLLARRVFNGELRGISKGAIKFFDPLSQLAMHRKWLNGETDRQHCPVPIILQRWSFGLRWANKQECTLNVKKPGGRLEWVGPIEGINPLKLMLFRRARPGEAHRAQYRAALALLKKAGLA
jgi:hypothetical protein